MFCIRRLITSYGRCAKLQNRNCYILKLNQCRQIFSKNDKKHTSKYGYPVEIYRDIITKDGYYLTIARIPHGKNEQPTEEELKKKEPILMIHGILMAADSYVGNAEESLAFRLADEGYDVWLGNMRSVNFSRKHVTLDPDKNKAFWNFGLDELGMYDLPAMVDYVIAKTEAQKIYYLGYSQGTIVFLIMCTEFPQYNDKIKLFISLAPAVYVQNNTHPLSHLLADNRQFLQYMVELFNLHEVGGMTRNMKALLSSDIFGRGNVISVSKLLMLILCGYNEAQMDDEIVQRIFTIFPRSTSSKQIFHFLQIYVNAKAAKYDFGPEQNLIKYGSTVPPEYNFRKVTVPAALYYCKKDYFVLPENARRLASELPNLAQLVLIEDDDFTHCDFLFAKNAPLLVTSRVIDIMKKFRSSK